MPLWVPEITKNAPMAVIEILQPERQSDFENVYELVRPEELLVCEWLHVENVAQAMCAARLQSGVDRHDGV
jgi:hypothetical protein